MSWSTRSDAIGGLRHLYRYSPHRALVGLGVLLIAVTVASGTLGVVNSARAERSATVLATRYLVLQPPTQALRASVSTFQATLAEPAGSAGVNTLMTGAAEATATDEDYVALHRLLALPVNADLPDLTSLYAAFSAARTNSLGAIVGPGVGSPSAARLSAAEDVAAARLATALGSLQATVTVRLEHTARQARAASAAARDDLLWCLGLGVPFAVAATALLSRKALRVERQLADRDAVQARLTRRNEFEGRLQRGLEMSKTEASVFHLVGVALGDASPHMGSELLLADSSRSHFRQVLVTPADADRTGCGVVSPDDCPAASRGQTMVFPESTAMDACPNLRGRACSALCVPVSISGNSVGVVHVTATDGLPPHDAVRRDIEVVARRASERLAMLRAFEVSQTQANSDSLTGLLTRRSLENQVRDLQDAGTAYSVAYGDLDRFKQLNDVFGHDAGDRALRTFAMVLRDALRPSDIACRYGGEEFVLVLPSCPVPEAVAILERVQERLADRLTAGRLPGFTVSFGVAFSEQAAAFAPVVTLADTALLRAKADGRDRIVVAASDPTAFDQPPLTDDSGESTALWDAGSFPHEALSEIQR
jgi:diguanylate cyclase (GGDEF)-like protein